MQEKLDKTDSRKYSLREKKSSKITGKVFEGIPEIVIKH
jgi:hypothetical protein